MRAFVPMMLLACLTGCSGEPPVEGDAIFEVGTGTWRFEELGDGQPVDLIRGAQGGWHVWVAARGTHVEDGDMIIIETEPADGSGSVQRVELQPNFDPENSSGFRNYLGWPAMLDGVDCLVGELLRVRATLVSLDGTSMTSERDIMVMAGADPPPMCAQ